MGGGFFLPLLSTWTGGGYVECPRLSTRGGEGVKVGSKLVHVVVECPLSVVSTEMHTFYAYILQYLLSQITAGKFILFSFYTNLRLKIYIKSFFFQA